MVKPFAKTRLIVFFLTVFLVTALGFFAFTSPSQSASIKLTTTADWQRGQLVGLEHASKQGELRLKADGTWGAQAWRTPDKPISVGSAFATDGSNIYVFRGYGDVAFWRYDASEDTWESLASAPFGTYFGADLQFHDGNIYALFGGYQKTFARYLVVENRWQILESFPSFVQQGGSLTSDGTYIYGTPGNSTQEFYRYDPNNNTWMALAPSPLTLRAGADLTHVNGFIYTPRGLNTFTFLRYEISTNIWQTMADTPLQLNDDIDITTDGANLYVARQQGFTSFMKYEILTNTWSMLADAPYGARYAGAQYLAEDGLIYFFRGNGDFRFWKCDPAQDIFLGPKESPLSLGLGSDFIYHGGYLYGPRGLNTTTLMRYHSASDTWETRADLPNDHRFNDDVRGVAVGDYLYYFRGSNTNDFYRYHPASDTWDSRESAPELVRFGAGLAYPGSGDYIYATRGATTSSFWRYQISTNTWETGFPDIPDTIRASYGATLLSDGQDIFFTPGLGMKRMYKYVIDLGSWQEIASMPFAPFYGTDTAYANGKILALAGWYKPELYEYDIEDDNWRRLPDLAGYGPTDIGPYSGASIVYDESNQSFYVTRGNSRLDLLTYSPGQHDYQSSGYWLSEPFDLIYVASWSSLKLTSDVPAGASVSLSTRSSSDAQTWSDWQAVSGQQINSPTTRYLQVRIDLTSTVDQTGTPRISNLEIEYQGDTTPPINPTAFTGNSQPMGGETLISGEAYRHLYPSFAWSGADDLETAVTGYYVYFGPDENANPVTDGTFQTTATFQTNSPLSEGFHYLRLSTVDQLENASDPVTGFIYHYQGVSPTLNLEVNQSGDFLGTATDVDTTSNRLQLVNKDGGFWLQERLSLIPFHTQWGGKNAAFVEETQKLYFFRGSNTSDFFEYDLTTDTWTVLAPAPDLVSYGGGVTQGPTGFLYGSRGNNTTDFWRYSIETDEWLTDVTNAPLTIGYGGAMVSDGQEYLFLTRGNNTNTFWRYDMSADQWSALSAVDFGMPNDSFTNNIHRAGDLVIDRDNQLIYATQGNYNKGFSVYDINTTSWQLLPDTPTLPYDGSALAYDKASHSIYLTAGSASNLFFRFDIASNQWQEQSSTPIPFAYGGGLHWVGDHLIGIRGGNSTLIYKYSLKKDSWLVPTRGLFGREFEGSSIFNMSYGSDMIRGDGEYFYLTRGNYSDDFVRWHQDTGEITRLANIPVGLYYDAGMVYVPGLERIYLAPGIYSTQFFYYDLATDTWHEETADPTPQVAHYGSSIIYDGERYLYFARGANSTLLYRFDTQSDSAGDKWSLVPNGPPGMPAGLSWGSELLIKNGFMYAMRGGNYNPNGLYRYDLASGGWSSLTALSTGLSYGGFITDGNDGHLYVAAGNNTSDFYRYSITDDQWQQMANVPGQIHVGGSGKSNLHNKIFVTAGAATNTYQDALYTYVMPTDHSGFVEEGEYISQSHDLTSVYRWAGLEVEAEFPTNTDLQIYTRVSEDNSDWSEWTAVSAKRLVGQKYIYRINSVPARYLQVKLALISADGVNSPKVGGYQINYYQDITPPTNPADSGLRAYSAAADGQVLVTNTWSNFPSPYFEWPAAEETDGASDTVTGSGVSGYYVYFGTDPLADPALEGTWQAQTTFTASSLENGQVYYLRIKTQDEAGNLATQAWAPFVYQYDALQPATPTELSADPAGFTATNSFTFSWQPVFKDGALVTDYCYKTGASEGDYASDQCQAETEVTGIPSYRVGANIFYVRTRDQAGNYSPYAQVSYFYADISAAPAPPRNLAVAPVTSTSNVFSFTWDAPAVGTFLGSESNLSYHYSVNALPSPFSTSTTSLKYLNPGAFATLPGENILYMVTKDEAGNINYSNYTQVSFFANTVAPGIPLDMEIADVSVKSTESWRLALSWDEPTNVGSGVASYEVYRSFDGSDFSLHSRSGGNSFVDTKLTQVLHYYKVKACDNTSNCGAFSDTVSLLPDGRYTEAAELVSAPVATDVTTKKAVINWVTARTSDSRVAFGTESGKYLDTEVSSSNHVSEHSLTLTNLSPGTTYYYVTRWTDEDGNLGSSEEATFTTQPPPSTEEPVARNVGLTSALIEFTSRNASRVKIYYGESSTFGGLKEVATSLTEGTYTVELDGLSDGTKYFFKINTIDIDGEEYEGETHSFETLPRPEVSDISITQVQGTAQTTLLVRWTANTEVSSIVTYFPSSRPDLAKDEVNIALKSGRHRMILYNLEPQQNYTLIIRGLDVAGNEASSTPQQVATAADTRPPQVIDLNVESEVVGEGEEAQVQLVVTFKTDEPATSQIEYGEGTGTTYSQRTQEDGALKSSHLVVISGLSPARVYHLRAVSQDAAGNVGESMDKVVVTPRATENALDLVLSNLQFIFGFMNTN